MTALPINISELLEGQIVEWERLEFKTGWNPEDVIHTMCAFANDFNNWGGGYLVIGVSEQDGQPVFPPIGLEPNKIDEIQKKILDLSYKLRPNYHPVVAPISFRGKLILVIWCPGGQTRPYQAPESLSKQSPYAYFIRRNSTTIKAQVKDIQMLNGLANQVPFDDRICHQATLEDLQLGLIKDFLREVKSDLFVEADKLSFAQLCRQMQIVQGPEEWLKPVNIGLLMFSDNPEKFFPYTRIDIVEFFDEIGDRFSEKIFRGPIHIQLKEALRYLNSMFVREEVRKRDDRAEADRFYNYPYIALEEALANAVYHKDYSQREPIEIRVYSNRIEIFSYPGPVPPLKVDDLNKGAARAHTYRNRRIGDFLKELHLTEGRCTGVPKIHRAMEKNGSPPAIFETDQDNLYFLTVLPIHPEVMQRRSEETRHLPGGSESKTHQEGGGFEMGIPEELKILINNLGKRPNIKQLRFAIQQLCAWKQLTAQQIAKILNRKDKKHLVDHHLTPMIKSGMLHYVYPAEQGLSTQAYIASL